MDCWKVLRLFVPVVSPWDRSGTVIVALRTGDALIGLAIGKFMARREVH